MTINYGNKKIKGVYYGTQNTNCITYIPQDIKYTLVDGVLTVKAGSKVYVPNGVNVFKEVVISGDKTISNVSSNGLNLITVTGSGNSVTAHYIDRVVSGATDSLAGTTYHLWYDTTNNIIKYYGSDTTDYSGTRCLPIALVTVTGSVITSIDQVFNGFGYIGHSLYMLPNVKFLCSDGFNSNGAYKNTEYIVPSVKVKTYSYNILNAVLFSDNRTLELSIDSQVYEVENTLPTPASNYERVYVRSENQWYYHMAGGTSWLKLNGMCVLGKGEFDGGKGITSLTPNPVQPEYIGREITRIYKGSTLVYGYKPDEVILEKSTAGTYTLNLEHSGDYEVTICGGGAGAAFNASSKFSDGVVSGGSGAGFKGIIHLKAGTYTVNVGAGGTSKQQYDASYTDGGAGGDSSIGSLLVAGGASSCRGGFHGSGNVISTGGVLTYDSSIVKSYTLATNGTDGGSQYNNSLNGASSVFSGQNWGAGGNAVYNAMVNGYDGYIKIVAL